VKRFEDAVVNPAEARFVVVTSRRGAGAARTERIVEELQGRKLAVERVLVNRVLPKTTDPAAEERRRQELNVAKALEKKIGLPVTVAPALGRYPAGLRELKSFRTAWYALTATQAKTRAAQLRRSRSERSAWRLPRSRSTSSGRSSSWRRRSTS
jgi:arsenite-transporting ATPase